MSGVKSKIAVAAVALTAALGAGAAEASVVKRLAEELKCGRGENKIFLMHGYDDQLHPSNSGEVNTPRPGVTSATRYLNYTGQKNRGYDVRGADNIFLDHFANVPVPVTRGIAIIGVERNTVGLANNDQAYLGDYIESGSGLGGGHIVPGAGYTHWNYIPTSADTAVLHASIDNMPTTSNPGTVLDRLNDDGAIDVYVQDDTAVDFAALALCVKRGDGDGKPRPKRIDQKGQRIQMQPSAVQPRGFIKQ